MNELETKTHKEHKEAIEDLLPGIDLVILDVDDTIASPKDPKFYHKQARAVTRALEKHFKVLPETLGEITQFYIHKYSEGKIGLVPEDIHTYLTDRHLRFAESDFLHDELVKLDPTGEFDPAIHKERLDLIRKLRASGKRIIVVTDSPEELSRKILREINIDPDKEFDFYLAYNKGTYPQKLLRGRELFAEISERFNVPHNRILSVGNSYREDIKPAESIGMKTVLIGNKHIEKYHGASTRTFEDFDKAYRVRYTPKS